MSCINSILSKHIESFFTELGNLYVSQNSQEDQWCHRPKSITYTRLIKN